MDEQEFLPKSLIEQAAICTRNQWAALNRYLEDRDLSIASDAAARSVRPVAIGRKAWLFVGSRRPGARAAVGMSLMASCTFNHMQPWAWLQTHSQHRWTIADRRKESAGRRPAWSW